MRVRLPLGRRALLGAGILAALIATLPARIVLDGLGAAAHGFTARAVRGTIWSGSAGEAMLGGLPLGDVRFGLDPLPLLLGRARLTLAGTDARGAVTVSRNRVALAADGWRVPAGARLAPLPVAAIALDGVEARLRDGLCEAAEGSARLELSGDPFGIGLPASLAGPVRCEAGALLLDASGGAARIRLSVKDAGVTATLSLRPDDPAAGAKLAATGFAPAPDGSYALILTLR